jgi:hypothetical protein
MIGAALVILARGFASRDQVGGALSFAAVPRVGLGPTTPPLCRCAERITDLIQARWQVLDSYAPTMPAALALGVSGVAAFWRSPKGRGQSHGHSAQAPGRAKLQMPRYCEFQSITCTT